MTSTVDNELEAQKALGTTKEFFVWIFYLTKKVRVRKIIAAGPVLHFDHVNALDNFWSSLDVNRILCKHKFHRRENLTVIAQVQRSDVETPHPPIIFLHCAGTRQLDMYHRVGISPWNPARAYAENIQCGSTEKTVVDYQEIYP